MDSISTFPLSVLTPNLVSEGRGPLFEPDPLDPLPEHLDQSSKAPTSSETVLRQLAP